MSREYRTIIIDSGTGSYVNRILVGTAATGLVRIEWVGARYGQIIPTNWSYVEMRQFMDSFIPLRYQVADAQNLIVKEAVEREFEWLLLLEHDVIMPPDAFLRINEYITHETYPVVSGLYFTRSYPSEPLIYRGRGTGSFREFHIGDLVYCDGVPTGILLIDMRILRLMWKDSEEYTIQYPGGPAITTRRVFDTPRTLWADPESHQVYSLTGTSDLGWCTKLIEGNYLRKAGWGEYVDKLPDKRWPLIVDTNIFCNHINPDGAQFPPVDFLAEYINPEQMEGEIIQEPPSLGISTGDGIGTSDKLG